MKLSLTKENKRDILVKFRSNDFSTVLDIYAKKSLGLNLTKIGPTLACSLNVNSQRKFKFYLVSYRFWRMTVTDILAMRFEVRPRSRRTGVSRWEAHSMT